MAACPHVCAVLAADSAFFGQTRAAIESIRRCDAELDVRLIAIGPYPRDERQWLAGAGVRLLEGVYDLPRFECAPRWAIAMTCRPHLPRLFPDVDGFVWLDADVRILSTAGLAAWVAQAADPSCPIAAVPETEPSYCFNANPADAQLYHGLKRARLLAVYGDAVARHFEGRNMHNAGLFAVPAGSPFWARYWLHLERSLPFRYDKMREQDALNLAIAECGVRSMPATLNWLCSLAMPTRSPDGRWLTPDGTGRAIDAAHLTMSDETIAFGGRTKSYYDMYREVGLA